MSRRVIPLMNDTYAFLAINLTYFLKKQVKSKLKNQKQCHFLDIEFIGFFEDRSEIMHIFMCMMCTVLCVILYGRKHNDHYF